MKDFAEHAIADLLGPSVLDQRQCELLAQYWKMAQPEQLEGRIRHRMDIGPDQYWIIVSPRPIGTCYENHQRLRHEN